MSRKNGHHVDSRLVFRCNAQYAVANYRDRATTESGEALGKRANSVSPHAVLNHLKHSLNQRQSEIGVVTRAPAVSRGTGDSMVCMGVKGKPAT
jgi:hypothetical protein